MRTRLAMLGLLATAGSAACADTSFPSPERVEKDRVIAGRVTVEGDAARATPAPGERASYELLVASPGPQVQWSYVLWVCRFVRDRDGVPSCDPSLRPLASTDAEAAIARPPDEPPRLAFVVPEELREDENALLAQGVVCPDGPFDEELLSALATADFSVLAAGRHPCADKSKNGLSIAAPFPIERASEERNHAPLIRAVSWSKVIEDAPVERGDAWVSSAEAETPETGCKGQGFVEIRRKERIGFQVELDEAARESYLDPSPIPGEPARRRTEIPYVEGFASAGRFEILRDNQLDSDQLLQLEWSLPKASVDPEGRLVRFWFVASDDRANDTRASSWIERALCVLP
jgi:hypothetical protein